jgi:hypothetical protein
MFEKTEWAIKNGQSRETGSLLHKTQNEDKQTKKQHRKLKRWARFLTNIYAINSHCSNEHNKDWSIHHTCFMQQQKCCGWIMLWHLQL